MTSIAIQQLQMVAAERKENEDAILTDVSTFFVVVCFLVGCEVSFPDLYFELCKWSLAVFSS